MHFVSKVAFVVSILFLTGACQQARLIPDEETKEATRGTEAATEEKKDSTNVDVDFDAKTGKVPLMRSLLLGEKSKNN